MSYFIAPDTGRRYDIFGHGGARAEAERIGAPFLGEVPLTMSIREASDAGRPVVAVDPDGEQAKAYLAIAERVQAAMAGQKIAPPASHYLRISHYWLSAPALPGAFSRRISIRRDAEAKLRFPWVA